MTIEHIGPAGQRFIDRATPYDLNHNVAAVVVLPDADGNVPDPAAIKRQIHERLQFVPRLRRRVVFPPRGTGQPFLADDPNFDLEHHVRTIEGGRMTRRRGQQIIGDFLQTPLDRGRALFEALLIYGIEDGRMAIALKAHHLILDGIMGWQSIAAVILDVDRAGVRMQADEWHPDPVPGRAAAARAGLSHRAQSARDRARGIGHTFTDPERRRAEIATLKAVPETVRAELAPRAPQLPINQPTGMHRGVAWARLPLADVKAVAHACPEHVTVNDIVLGIVAETLRAVLVDMGVPEPLPAPRVMVPISLMVHGDGPVTFDQKDTYMIVTLDLEQTDIVERVCGIHAQTEQRKSGPATVIESLNELVLALPAHERDRVWALLASPHEYNVIVSNIRGLEVPVYVQGHDVETLSAIAGLPPGHALRIVAISAGDALTFGFTVDSDIIGNVDLLERAALESLQRLVEATRAG